MSELSFSKGVSAFGDGVGVGVPPIAPIGSPMAVGVGLGDAALIVTPLFQTSFVPDLMQVNFLPEAIAVEPALVHLAPALGVAAWRGVARERRRAIAISRRPLFFM